MKRDAEKAKFKETLKAFVEGLTQHVSTEDSQWTIKVFVPPIKCQGIKTKLVPWILANVILPESGKWIEPFLGSGVVGFNCRQRNALLADKNPHLINFYRAIQMGDITPAKAKAFLEAEGDRLSREGGDHYYAARERFNQTGNPYDFLFLNRSCFNGLIRFNRHGGFNSDPPYLGRHVDYYDSWSEEDECDLAKLLASTHAKFIVSTWHSTQYRQNTTLERYWSHYTILARQHFYQVGGKEENRNPMLEALVMNFTPAVAAQAATIPQEDEQLVLPDNVPVYCVLSNKDTD